MSSLSSCSPGSGTRRRQQGSGIDDGNRFGKPFISFLTSLMGGHTFLLLQVSDSSDRTDRSKLRALLQPVSLSMMIILVILFPSTIFFYLIKAFKPFTGFCYGYILTLYYKCYITK